MYLFFSTDSFTAPINTFEADNHEDIVSVFNGVSYLKIDSNTKVQKLLTISIVILNEHFELIKSNSYIIKDDVKYTKNALNVINSFDDIKETEFVHIDDVKVEIIDTFKSSKYLISHYTDHHIEQLFNALDLESIHQIFELLYDQPAKVTSIDILKVGMPFTNKKMYETGFRLRRPSLAEVYSWLYDHPTSITNSNDNVKALIDCFKELKNRGMIGELHPNIEYVDALIKSKLKLHLNSPLQK